MVFGALPIGFTHCMLNGRIARAYRVSVYSLTSRWVSKSMFSTHSTFG